MDKRIVLIEVIKGVATVVHKPDNVHVAIVDWDIAKGGFDVDDIAKMLRSQGMVSDKAFYYAQRMYDRDFEIEDEVEEVMVEFLHGTFDQSFITKGEQND